MFFNHSVYQLSSNWHHIWVWCSRKAVIDSSPLVDFPFSQEYIIFIIMVGRRSYVFTTTQFFFFCWCFICILVPFHACKCQMILGSMNDMSYAKCCWGGRIMKDEFAKWYSLIHYLFCTTFIMVQSIFFMIILRIGMISKITP